MHRQDDQTTVLAMAWTYILRCSDGSFYVGSTIDLDGRVSQHNLGLGAAYTRKRRPVELVWAAEFARVEDAFAFEKQVQGWGRRKRQALIDGDVAMLPDLASRSWAARRGRAAVAEADGRSGGSRDRRQGDFLDHRGR